LLKFLNKQGEAMESHFVFILFLFCLRSFQANGTNNNYNCSSKSPWEKYMIPNPTSLPEAKSPESLVNLRKWYGRLGNNFYQLKQAFRIAICCRTQLELLINRDLPLLKRHFDFSNLKEGNLVSGLNESVGCHKLQVSWVNGYREKGTPFSIDESCSYDSHALFNWALYDAVYQDERCTESNDVKKALGMDCPQYLEDDALVVQIRSGDIFKIGHHPQPTYKQPPVAFYEKIFQT
jgi:hypothetical protein